VPEKNGKWKLWLYMLVSAIGVGAFVYFRISYLHSQGKNIFWLAELFSPAAVISILVVTFVEKLVSPGSKAHARKKTR
jgi:hypothetical protein